MERNRAAVILEVAILHEMVLNWTDCKQLEAGIRRGLDEIMCRQQEDGPEVIKMPPVR